MFQEDKKINNLEALFYELKKYIELRSDVLKLDLTEKLTIIFSRLILIMVLIVLGFVILFNCSFMLAYAIDSHLHNLTQSFACVGGILVFLALCIFMMRKRLITQPLVNFFGRLLLEKGNKRKS